ncbi:DUF1206 domain-containing protein [Phenylobacterium immobile]|uniref:DUF1206 domain-containing protein n=1 Tax=Phenylobacterium immobile TaxID=21 RepID=UPI000AE0FE23|nr:DUF1206 domain-containing protein [Phenylobacterium immobile]
MSGVGVRRFVRRLPLADAFPHWVRPLATVVEVGARLGYVARGAVYVSIGAIALLAALGLTPRAVGVVGALEAWGEWPPGVALLWVIGLGLYAFAGWRALQAIFDADRLGTSLSAWAARAGKAFGGLTHVALAISVFGLLDAIEDLREVDDQASTRAFVEQALAQPLGDLMVIGVGLVVAVVGLADMVRAPGGRFAADLECRGVTARWANRTARFGYAGRGFAMLLVGVVTMMAGWHARSAEAGGLGAALEVLKDQPFGRWILGATALGLVAFGAFNFLKAAFRRIGC